MRRSLALLLLLIGALLGATTLRPAWGGAFAPAAAPVGSLMLAAGSTPTGYLACDGSAVSRTTYSTLFAAISTNYGIGDGATTFNLPAISGAFPSAPLAPVDQYSSNVTLLLRGDAPYGQASFYDDKGHAVTRTGTAICTPAQAKFGAGSILSSAASDRLSLADSADWDFGSSAFCIDAWVYFNSNSATSKAVWAQDGGAATFSPVLFAVANGKLVVYASTNGASWDALNGGTASTTITTGAWHHVALSRSSNTWKMFLDGAEDYSASASGTVFNSTATAGTLQFQNNAVAWDGYIDHLRVTKGVARYTGAFTPEAPATLGWVIKR